MASDRVLNKLVRAFHYVPGYHLLVRRMLSHASEISLTEARFLGGLAQQVPADRCIVEIGTLFGESTRVLAMFKASGTPLITVDSFRWNPHGLRRKDHARITHGLLAEATTSHDVELREMDKAAFYASYQGGPPGLVFLDANHSYESTKADISWAQSVQAGIICGHDYSARFPGVTKAVDECGGAKQVVDTLFVL
ncbi:MAG: class I SAM-dependent methyltransferase [Gemmatimonadota bacterium]